MVTKFMHIRFEPTDKGDVKSIVKEYDTMDENAKRSLAADLKTTKAAVERFLKRKMK